MPKGVPKLRRLNYSNPKDHLVFDKRLKKLSQGRLIRTGGIISGSARTSFLCKKHNVEFLWSPSGIVVTLNNSAYGPNWSAGCGQCKVDNGYARYADQKDYDKQLYAYSKGRVTRIGELGDLQKRTEKKLGAHVSTSTRVRSPHTSGNRVLANLILETRIRKMTVEAQLPPWATIRVDEADGRSKVFFNPAIVYPLFLTELGFEIDKYGVEMARRCAIKDIHSVLGDGTWIKITAAPGWALKELQDGRGAEAAQDIFEFNRVYEGLQEKRARREAK